MLRRASRTPGNLNDMNTAKQLSIVLVNDTYYPNVDGVVKTVDSYARQLCKNHRTVVCVPYQGSCDDDYPYRVIRVTSLPVPRMVFRLTLPRLSRELHSCLKKDKIDIVHIHSPFAIGRYAMRIAKKRGIPVVATFHSKFYDDFVNYTHSRLIARCAVRRIVRFFERADEVWAVSRGTAETLRSYGYRGEIHITENGTDFAYPDNAESLRRAAAEKLNLTKERPIILFVGQQIWHKNLRLVIDTCSVMKKRGIPFRAVIVGMGFDAEAIKKHALDSGLGEEDMLFTGVIRDRELLAGIELCSDIFFFPSMYDNAPLVVREAAAMRLPSVLLRGSNAAEPTRDGENAIHVPDNAEEAADIIADYLSKPQLLREIGVNASRTIGKRWEEIIPSVVREYGRLSGTDSR